MIIRRLLSILGRRTMLTFGLVTFLVGAVLATVNITSRYALKTYVDDQLKRIPWDLAVYQRGALNGDQTLKTFIAGEPGVKNVASLAFLRARFPEGAEVEAQVDHKPFTTSWLCLLSASDMSLLPPELGFALAKGGSDADRGGILALIGPEYAMGKAFLALQGAKDFTVQVHVAGQPRYLFNTPLRAVVRLDRDDLNRWLMEQTGSVSYVPFVGAVLLMPYNWDILNKFDQVASGFVPGQMIGLQMGEGDEEVGHVQEAEYAPEMIYVAKIDRARLISGWDIPGSLARVRALTAALQHGVIAHAPTRKQIYTGTPEHAHAHEADPGENDTLDENFTRSGFVVDSTTEVLLDSMQTIARLIAVVSLLVALPLLWMAWVLAGNLAGLLMLNERRTLGLMRLRGISGQTMGRALLLSVTAGGLAGGVLGLAAGSVVPLLIYERGHLPVDVLLDERQLLIFGAFLLVSVVLALVVSRRVVKYATTISPLEASRRVSGSEAVSASVHFAAVQAISLMVGTYVLAGWIFDFSISRTPGLAWFRVPERLLDFLGLPLFLYGITTLLASKRERIQHVMAPVLRPIGGVLGRFALRHMSAKPHRTAAFLLIVALMSSLSLYPIITSRSFENKAIRGAKVQIGADWQILYNTPDLVAVDSLTGPVSHQLAALKPQIAKLMGSLERVNGVRGGTYMVESLLPSFYLPGYGLKGVPMYLLASTDAYKNGVYSEPTIGLTSSFDDIMAKTAAHGVAVSAPVADFWSLAPGTKAIVGLDDNRRSVELSTAGTLSFLPGLPPKSISDRHGYVQARIDYLNYLFSTNAYLATGMDNPNSQDLEALLPRVVVLLKADPTPDPAAFQAALAKASPVPPLEIHSLDQEIGKVGSDMYISLALANMRIYLVGGLLLALLAILAIAMANYSDDRRTLALLRIRGASPAAMCRFVVAMLLSPALVGLVLGAVAAILAGFGLANYVWKLRNVKSVVELLPTRLVVSILTAWIALLIVGLLVAVALGFSWWVYRDTAQKSIQDA